MTASDGAANLDTARRPADVLSGVVVATVGLLCSIAALRLPGGEPGQPGPGAFPLVVGVGMVIVGALMLVPRFARQLNAPLETEEGDDTGTGGAPRWHTVAVWALVLFAYVALWPIVGMPVSALLIFAVSTIARRDRWRINLALAISFSILIALVFDRGLGIPVPSLGLIPEIGL